MPLGNERISSNVERVVKRGACTLSKRSPNRNIYNFPLKERSLSFPGLRNSEQRCSVLWVAVGHGSQKLLLVPLYIFLQGIEGRNQLGCKAGTNPAYLESLEQRNTFPERPGSAESSTASSSSGASILGKSHNRSKRTKSVKSFSSSSHASSVLNNTSGSGFDVVASGESVDSIPEVGKPVKKRSTKKRKKKGKQYKRSSNGDALVVSQCEEGIHYVPVSETAMSSRPASPGDNISQNMLEKVTFADFPMQGIEEDNSAENSNDCRNKSATGPACTSYNGEMYNSEPMTSLPWGFCVEKLINNHSGRSENLNHAISSYSTTSSEIILSTASGNTSNVHPKQNGICDTSEIVISTSSDSASSISDDQSSLSDPNSFLDELKITTFENSNEVENCGNASKQSSVMNKYACNSSEGEMTLNSVEHKDPCQSITTDSYDKGSRISSYCSMDSPDWSMYVVDADSTNERVQCSSEACSSNDFHPVVYRKRGRQGRKASLNSNRLHKSGTVNLLGKAGEGNNHPIWKKVQNNGTEGCIHGSKNDNLAHHHVDISSKGSVVWEEVEGWKHNASRQFCSHPCSDEKVIDASDLDPIQSAFSDANSNDLSKPINGSSPSNQECQGFTKEPDNGKISMARESKIHIQRGVEISPQVIKQQKTDSQSTLLNTKEFRSAVIMQSNDTFHYCKSEQVWDKKINTLEAQSEMSSLHVEPDLLEKTYSKVHSSGGIIDNEDGQSMKLESKSMRLKNCQEVPITNHLTPDGLKSVKMLELSTSNSHHLVLSNNGTLPCLSSHSEGADSTCSQPPEMDELSCWVGSHPFPIDKFSVVGEARPYTCLETALCKIMQAVDESYKFLTASEAIHLMTGRPLAEFERLLHAASPNINQSISSCKTCSGDQIIGDASCTHQVSCISLANLWQWYEKPGSYGLEVKVEDHYNSKRSRNGCSQFRAYFVPYLSAVQLFARSRSSVCFNHGASNREAKEFCKEDKASKSSCLESLPIFSTLLPESCKVVPSVKDEIYCKTITSSILSDEELLFEYFEVDQPQQRRPLFEKIKELVRGGASCKYQMFGDPSKLECLNLHDLHPASWFSVAWYPIYRIPDGNFRAAFLTYHSLGHLVHRRSSSNVIGDITEIVSPVVGMQSYNAKGECWFVQRSFNSNVGHPEKATPPNPSQTLSERLRTLEHAASVMARATVHKGTQKFVNSHPDYEFFLSRRH